MTSGLRLRPLSIGDERCVLEAHMNFKESDDFQFLLGYDEAMPWSRFVDHVAARRIGKEIPMDGWSPRSCWPKSTGNW
jgi:hypothetical protein